MLSLEFIGGSLAFLWPNITEGLGAAIRIGTFDDILLAEPRFAQGYPYASAPARSFLINVPAARAVANDEDSRPAIATAGEMVALWRTCPHLGCIVPDLCESLKRFECRCHGSTYNILSEKLGKGFAERGMDRFAVVVEEDGGVVIDTRENHPRRPGRGRHIHRSTSCRHRLLLTGWVKFYGQMMLSSRSGSLRSIRAKPSGARSRVS